MVYGSRTTTRAHNTHRIHIVRVHTTLTAEFAALYPSSSSRVLSRRSTSCGIQETAEAGAAYTCTAASVRGVLFEPFSSSLFLSVCACLFTGWCLAMVRHEIASSLVSKKSVSLFCGQPFYSSASLSSQPSLQSWKWAANPAVVRLITRLLNDKNNDCLIWLWWCCAPSHQDTRDNFATSSRNHRVSWEMIKMCPLQFKYSGMVSETTHLCSVPLFCS